MNRMKTERLKQLALVLGTLLFIPQDSSFSPRSEFYAVRKPSNAPSVYLFDISLTDPKLYPIDSLKLLSHLSKLNSAHHRELVGEIESLFQKIEPSQAKERLRLLKIAHLVGRISQSGKINQLLIDQSEKFSNSYHPIESEISRLGLEFYMELEADSQLKRSQINRVVSTIIHVEALPEKRHCNFPDLYLSKPTCEKKSKQPCRLVAIQYDTQADACWKPLVSETKGPPKEIYSKTNNKEKNCKIFALKWLNDEALQEISAPERHRRCRLNHYKSLLEFDQSSITFGTDCRRCSDTLLEQKKPQESPIQILFRKNKESQVTWLTDDCRGNPSWNHEFQNGHNFSIEEVGPENKSKNYFGFRMDQCTTDLTRSRASTYYF